MSDNELQTRIATAEAYEEFFIPALIREWASRVIDAARIQPGDKVLDVACGTGIVARTAAQRVGSGGTVAGLDRNPSMLEVARRMATGIEWRQGEAESLPYSDETFDAVVCQFGLMFFTDRPLALREMMRVLVNHGRLALTVWDRLESMPAFAAEIEVVERIDHDAKRPFHVAEDLGDGETAFLRGLMIRAALHDDGIDERERRWILVADVYDRDTSRDADLVGGEPHALGGAHRVEQIVHEPAHFVVHPGVARGLLSQHR